MIRGTPRTPPMSKVAVDRSSYRKIQIAVALQAKNAESRLQCGTEVGEMTSSGLDDLW